MDDAFKGVDINNASLLNSQDGSTLNGQVDRIRMVTVSTESRVNYNDSVKWSYVICFMYALRKFGEYVTVDYYKDLCTKAFAINDYGLFGIAFENYVHTMTRKELPIPLKIRKYDRVKTKDIHKYDSLIIQTRTSNYLLKGESEDECKQIIVSDLGSIDCWHPCSLSLKTIDCVA
jgi:hypothetical protein